jgi:hypothetical protein
LASPLRTVARALQSAAKATTSAASSSAIGWA